MLNYMKSECYRTLRGKSFYLVAAVLSGFVLSVNVLLTIVEHFTPGFRYGDFRFFLNMYTGDIYIMVVLGACIAGWLFWDDRKNGVLKNVVAYGISREKIFLGKCLVSFGFTFLILCIVLAVYLGSAYLLRPNPEWIAVKEMLTGTAAILPSAAASLIFSILLGILFQKEMTAVILWVAVYYIFPMVCFFAGLQIGFIGKIAEWLPYGFIQMEAVVTFSDYRCLWDTAAGFSKCMISGFGGILIFLALGVWAIRKQEF